MAESIQKELDEYRASEEEVKRLKNVMVGFKVCILVSPGITIGEGNDKMGFGWPVISVFVNSQKDQNSIQCMLWLKSKT